MKNKIPIEIKNRIQR